MPPVGGEIFSALAQKASGAVTALLPGAPRQGLQCSHSVLRAARPTCVKTVLLLLLARDRKKMPSRIKCQCSKGLALLALVPITAETFDSRGEPVCPEQSALRKVLGGKGPGLQRGHVLLCHLSSS